jgi:hypothetical protein
MLLIYEAFLTLPHLLMTENPKEINDSLIVIGHKSKIQPIYRTELRESAPDIAKEAAEALSKYQLNLIDPALEKGLEVIDSKEAVSIANQHRKREKINLGLNIEGQRLNESENLRHTNNPQENIIAFNDRTQDEVDTMVSLIREGLATALKNGIHIKTPQIQEQGKRAAIEANNILNDQKPPEIVKEPQQQDLAMTR